MAEYISREAAIANSREYDLGGSYDNTELAVPVDAIISIPAADVRPVALCRDCINSYEWANMDGDNYRYCSLLRSRWNRDTDRMVYDDDFCSWGVKREES